MSQKQAKLDRQVLENPGAMQQWLNALPLANIGATTRLLFDAVLLIGKLDIAAQERFAQLEALRPRVRYVLTHLNKYYTAATYPLPKKSQKVIDINNTLLLEMAKGYTRIIGDRSAAEMGRDAIATTLYRACHFLGEYLLRTVQIYSDYRSGVWKALHQLYQRAEVYKMTEQRIVDEERGAGPGTIGRVYKQILLLFTLQPRGLGHGEAQKLYDLSQEWSELAVLQSELPATEAICYVVDLARDAPPDPDFPEDLERAKRLRYLDLTDLSFQLSQRRVPGSAISGVTDADHLTARALTRWQQRPSRRHERKQTSHNVNVAIGLHRIKRLLQQSNGQMEPPQAGDESLRLLDPREEILASGSELGHHNLAPEYQFWDLVAQGRSTAPRPAPAPAPSGVESDVCSRWRVINVSSGGCALQWESSESVSVLVGEILTLSAEGESSTWQLAVIRWLEIDGNHQLTIGVEFLATQVEAMSFERALSDGAWDYDGLFLRAQPPYQQNRLVVPAYMLKSGDRIRMTVTSAVFDVELGTLLDHTDFFSIFEFQELTQESQENLTDLSAEDDSFWNSL